MRRAKRMPPGAQAPTAAEQAAEGGQLPGSPRRSG
jgi:hypothetical protein